LASLIAHVRYAPLCTVVQAVAAETQQLRETLAAKAAALEEVKQRQKDMNRLATSRTRDEARLKGTANQ
jgi:hypothetical protein